MNENTALFEVFSTLDGKFQGAFNLADTIDIFAEESDRVAHLRLAPHLNGDTDTPCLNSDDCRAAIDKSKINIAPKVADLSGANLAGADLHNADLTRAYLTDANLRDATGLPDANISQ